MSKLYDRRNFLQAAASLLAAPAILLNQNAIAAFEGKTTALTTPPPPPLEVLYDTLGNATTGWSWVGQGIYSSILSNSLALNYIIVTCYIGTLSSPKRLRGFECAVTARNSVSGMNMPLSNFLGRFYLGIWRTDVGTFYQDPVPNGSPGGSLTRIVFGANNPNVGSVSTPVGITGSSSVYFIGWDNLDVMLPANVGIQMAFYAEGIQLGDVLGVCGSSRPGPNMLRASTTSGNTTIGQPMATRITVSDLVPTAASVGIFGRVVNKLERLRFAYMV